MLTLFIREVDRFPNPEVPKDENHVQGTQRQREQKRVSSIKFKHAVRFSFNDIRGKSGLN